MASEIDPQRPGLAKLIQAWDRLPEAVRAGILAMVDAACPVPQHDTHQAPVPADPQAPADHDAEDVHDNPAGTYAGRGAAGQDGQGTAPNGKGVN